jgi:3-hydroxyacyl-CoA dehydrogenase
MGPVEHPLTVAILGAGPEACEAACLRAHAGHLVRLYAPHADALAEAAARIRGVLERLLTDGALTAAERQRTLDGIVGTVDLDEALAGAAVVLDHRS